MDAAAHVETHGPILGLTAIADAETAAAGYVGMGSLWLGDVPAARYLYTCPRCKSDTLVESDA